MPAIDALADRLSTYLGADQVNLAHHAFARADQSCFPLFLNLAPARIGEALEKKIRSIERSNRPIEIDEDVKLHTRTRPVVGTC